MDCKKVIETCEKMISLRRSELRQALMQNGMHLGQPEMLNFVAEHPGCTQRQIAENSGVTAASIAASFKRMEHSGLIYRQTDEADLRCNRVFISDKGKVALERCKAAVAAINGEMLAGLSDDELHAFCRCMEKINSNLLSNAKKGA